jgi:hypothetical protein
MPVAMELDMRYRARPFRLGGGDIGLENLHSRIFWGIDEHDSYE